MKRILFGLFLISISIVGIGEASAQCTCIRTYPTAFDELKDSEAVFIGEVLNVETIERPYKHRPDAYDLEIKFKVKKVWRKDIDQQIALRFLVDGCISSFDKGAEYLVYAFRDKEGRLRTFCCCSRTRPLAKAAQDLEEFQKMGEKPKHVIATSKPNKALQLTAR
jgi:hypothetical protein